MMRIRPGGVTGPYRTCKANTRGDHVKLRRTRITAGLLVLALVASVPLATTALAQPDVVAGITPNDAVAPGEETTLTFTIEPADAEVTVASFSLTPPTNWQLVSDDSEASPSPSPGAPEYTIDGNTLIGSGLSATSGSPATVQFRVKTGCKNGAWAWTLDARDPENTQFGNGESDLTTDVSGDCALAIATQPTDAEKSTLITGTPFDSSTNFVSVALENGLEQTVTYFPVDVSFDLATGAGLASGSLTVVSKTTVNGVATFGPVATLSISSPDEPLVEDYKLEPKTVGTYAGLTGANSAGFDIWGDGCRGAHCQTTLTPPDKTSLDTYETFEDVGMGTSVVVTGGTILNCPDQKVIFDTLDLETETLFFHVTGGDEPVFLFSHITRHDMKEATNNGQKHVGWCVGLKSKGPWNFTRKDTNGDGVTDSNTGIWEAGSDLWVGMAPKCPRKNAADFAPCIVSQMGDNNGGSFIRGWLPGGDPPRRT